MGTVKAITRYGSRGNKRAGQHATRRISEQANRPTGSLPPNGWEQGGQELNDRDQGENNLLIYVF